MQIWIRDIRIGWGVLQGRLQHSFTNTTEKSWKAVRVVRTRVRPATVTNIRFSKFPERTAISGLSKAHDRRQVKYGDSGHAPGGLRGNHREQRIVGAWLFSFYSRGKLVNSGHGIYEMGRWTDTCSHLRKQQIIYSRRSFPKLFLDGWKNYHIECMIKDNKSNLLVWFLYR